MVALVLAVRAADAQVLEIRADGSSVTWSGPVVSTGAGVVPLASSPASHRTAPLDSFQRAALRHEVSPKLIEAVAWQESRWNPNALSPKGARGVMQLMPATARAMGVDANDPDANIDGGAAYLALMLHRFDGDLVRSLAAYNAGPEAVDRYGGVPPYRETQDFVGRVLDHLAQEVQR
jgi:soluble lytic murein transglycosylase-like protein